MTCYVFKYYVALLATDLTSNYIFGLPVSDGKERTIFSNTSIIIKEGKLFKLTFFSLFEMQNTVTAALLLRLGI